MDGKLIARCEIRGDYRGRGVTPKCLLRIVGVMPTEVIDSDEKVMDSIFSKGYGIYAFDVNIRGVYGNVSVEVENEADCKKRVSEFNNKLAEKGFEIEYKGIVVIDLNEIKDVITQRGLCKKVTDALVHEAKGEDISKLKVFNSSEYTSKLNELYELEVKEEAKRKELEAREEARKKEAEEKEKARRMVEVKQD